MPGKGCYVFEASGGRIGERGGRKGWEKSEIGLGREWEVTPHDFSIQVLYNFFNSGVWFSGTHGVEGGVGVPYNLPNPLHFNVLISKMPVSLGNVGFLIFRHEESIIWIMSCFLLIYHKLRPTEFILYVLSNVRSNITRSSKVHSTFSSCDYMWWYKRKLRIPSGTAG